MAGGPGAFRPGQARARDPATHGLRDRPVSRQVCQRFASAAPQEDTKDVGEELARWEGAATGDCFTGEPGGRSQRLSVHGALVADQRAKDGFRQVGFDRAAPCRLDRQNGGASDRSANLAAPLEMSRPGAPSQKSPLSFSSPPASAASAFDPAAPKAPRTLICWGALDLRVPSLRRSRVMRPCRRRNLGYVAT